MCELVFFYLIEWFIEKKSEVLLSAIIIVEKFVIENVSSDIYNEHVAEVMEAWLSLARVAAAHPPTARKSSRRYLCPEMPPHDTPSLHVCICREKFSESMFLSQLCVEVFLCLYWFILMLTYCRFGCNISQFIVRKKSYLELMKNLFCVAQYIFVKYHFYSL